MQTNTIDILLVDQSGRGHALCDLFVRTNDRVKVYYGPGSDLVQHERIIVAPEIDLDDVTTVVKFCQAHPVAFVFVSFIEALASGFVDTLKSHGICVIGPSRDASQLEASKAFANTFCERYGLPCGRFQAFDQELAALKYIDTLDYACVVKADGLCKMSDGVTVCDSSDEAKSAVARIFLEQPEASITIEERLYGREISIFALLDGEHALLFPTAFDYKRVSERDSGKNCDGMGSIAPHPLENDDLREEIQKSILSPLLGGLKQEGLEFTGFVYVGAMITEDGLKIIEINARFGDSEAEAVLPGIHNDFYALCQAVLRRELNTCELAIDGFIRCSVAVTQGKLPSEGDDIPGWPFGAFSTGQVINGLDTSNQNNWQTFIAGASRNDLGLAVTTGGRVLHVVGKGRVASKAIEHAYRGISNIEFSGMQYRGDIGASIVNLWRDRKNEWLQLDWLQILQHALPSATSQSNPAPYFLSVLRTLEILRSASLPLFDGSRDASHLAALTRELIPELKSCETTALTEYLIQLKILANESNRDVKASDDVTALALDALKPMHFQSAHMST